MAGCILQDDGRRNQLKDILARTDDGAPPRIVNIASAGNLLGFASEFVEDTAAGAHKGKGWPGTCYGFSKLCLIAYTKILAMKNDGILINSVCPGWCATDMSSHGGPRSAAKGAETPIFLASSDKVTSSGGFYQDLKEVEW